MTIVLVHSKVASCIGAVCGEFLYPRVELGGHGHGWS